MKSVDGQNDFRGGMTDVVPPERIPENAYVFAENMEMVDGILKSRRTHELLFGGIENGGRLIGSGVYYSGEYEYPVIALRTAAGVLKTYWIDLVNKVSTEITLDDVGIGEMPYTIETDAVVFNQYGNLFYMVRRDDGGSVYRWDGLVGNEDHSWTLLDSIAPTEATDEDWCPKSFLMKSAYGRTWIAVKNSGSDAFDCIMSSDIMLNSGKLVWDEAERHWKIGDDDQTNILAVEEYTGGALLVFKRDSVYALHECNGDLAGFWIERITDWSGTVGSRAVCKAGSDVVYVDADGIRTVNTDVQNNARATVKPISYAISRFWNEKLTMNSPERYLMCAVCFDGKLYVTVPYGYGSHITSILVYNIEYACWESVWSGVPFVQILSVRHLNYPRLCSICDNGVIYGLLVEGRFGADTEFASMVQTRAFTAGEVEATKAFKRALFGVTGAGVTLSADVVDCDTYGTQRVFSGVVSSPGGWMWIIPDEGVDIPDEGIQLGDIGSERKMCYAGFVGRGIGFIFNCSGGAWDLRSLSVEASAHGRKFKEF